ncbi:MAG: BrnT family toxin [Planctomycetaceae bacterium]
MTFDEASTDFADPLGVIFEDEAHSQHELREILVGHSVFQRLLLVCFTERTDDVIRIIVRGRLRNGNGEIMKKASGRKSTTRESDDLRKEYRFDYSNAAPNRFATRVDKNRRVVALDPDVSKVFTSSEAVNEILRALIKTMPTAT